MNMKKFFILAMLLLIASPLARAVNVDATTAQAKAERFLFNQIAAGRMMANASHLKLAHTEMNSRLAETPVYYVFSATNGFVIVSGEDRAREILAYGDSPVTDVQDLPINMKCWLDYYKRQLEYLQANPGIEVEGVVLNSAKTGQVVYPLLTANWSQNTPYWNECPVFGSDTCYTGCPATSLSMVFHYWKYPKQQTPAAPSYMMPSYGVTLPELPPTVFDWDNMLDDYTGGYTPIQAAAVAHLMRYIGQVEEMDYTISGSGAYGKDVLRAVKYFEYDQNAQLLFKTDELGYANYSDAQWGNLIQAELEAGRPIVYLAYDNDTGAGHAFNVDGYDGSGNYHINWGWNGRGNGYFALNAFSYADYTFGTGQQMVIGIQPPTDFQHPRLQAYPNVLDIQAYVGKPSTTVINLKGTNLTAGVSLSLNDPDGVFSIDAESLTQAHAEAGCELVVTYAPQAVGTNNATIVCSSEGADVLTITLNGTALFEAYMPMLLPANESRITLTSFRAEWTDATPAHNVASYMLEVQAKPEYILLEEADFSGLPQMSPSNQASHATDYLPEGWGFTGSEFNLEGGCIMPRRNGVITTDALQLRGYDKVTVVVTGRSYGSWGDQSELTISTSLASETISFPFSYAAVTVVLDAAEGDIISFKAGYYPMIQKIQIYAGDASGAQLRANESGNESYRLISDITNKFYIVNNLAAGGSFFYRVKALYTNGTESEWSDSELVTLVDGGHAYELGDVNHDENVSISDVTALIDYLLGSDNNECVICADVNCDDAVTISDVTALIDILLSGN